MFKIYKVWILFQIYALKATSFYLVGNGLGSTYDNKYESLCLTHVVNFNHNRYRLRSHFQTSESFDTLLLKKANKISSEIRVNF